jgi:hypothetical protein
MRASRKTTAFPRRWNPIRVRFGQRWALGAVSHTCADRSGEECVDIERNGGGGRVKAGYYPGIAGVGKEKYRGIRGGEAAGEVWRGDVGLSAWPTCSRWR